jgi:putative Ca2+/H+ antiporter (TMEM165/GDT1 family)
MNFDPKLFASALLITFLAELPDKTAFASFVLSTRRRAMAVFVGGAAAMVVHSAIAVGLGSLLAALPKEPVRIFSGLVFLVFAVLMWRRKEEEDEALEGQSKRGEGFWPTAMAAFGVIFVVEWGDLTQFSTAALAAKTGQPLTIFLAAVAGLWAAIGLAGWLGKHAGGAMHPVHLQRLASLAFAGLGVLILAGII